VLFLTVKELKGYFRTPIAYIYLCTFLTGVSWFFFQGFFISNQAKMRGFFELLPWFFLFLLPAITMRLWSEEKRLCTFEMLLTLPVKDYELILGKFLSAFVFLVFSLILTFNIPATLFYLGQPDIGPIIGGYIGAMLMASVFLAVGLFASSITSNQIVAFILSVFISLILLIIGQSAFLYNFNASAAYYISRLSVSTHFSSISRGILDSRDIIYYISFTVLFLYLNSLILTLRGSKKKFIGELVKVLGVLWKSLLVLAVVLLVNLFADKFYFRFDLTKNKRYTLATASRNVVRKLKKPLNIRLYFSENLPSYMASLRRDVSDVVSDYASYSSGLVEVESLNPDTDKVIENRLIKMGIPKVQLNVFEGDEAGIRSAFLGIELEYGKKREVLPVVQSTHGLEYNLTSKIHKITQDRVKTVAFLSGHGERSIYKKYSKLKKLLEEIYTVKEVNFAMGRTLSGVDMLLISGPREELPDSDAFLIDQFIMSGGKVVFMMDSYSIDWSSMHTIPVELDSWVKFLAHYRIKIGRGMLHDSMCARAKFQQSSMQFSPAYPFWPKVTPPGMNNNNPVVSTLPSFVFPWASPISVGEMSDVSFAFLAKTSPFTVVKKGDRINLTPLKRYNPHSRKTEAPTKQRVLLAGVLQGEFKSYFKNAGAEFLRNMQDETDTEKYISASSVTQIAVMGTSHIVENDMLNAFPNNSRFFLNLVDWMNMGSDLIAIRSRNIEESPLRKLSSDQKFMIKQVNVFLWVVVCALLFGSVGLVKLMKEKP